jgi:alpha-D-ribose 1-methylphosphonate 5-triphosphate synthase subunit PhnG
MQTENIPSNEGRQRVAALLARASMEELMSVWSGLEQTPEAEKLRGPETGLVMVRGRIGGGGDAFNLGEATMTRATIRLASGTVGHAHALGTNKKKAWVSAIFDALWQEPATRDMIEANLLSPVEQRLQATANQKKQETAATRVNFFTMVRGDD